MPRIKGTLVALATAATLAFAGNALAQGEGSDNTVWMSGSNGMHAMHFTTAGMKAFMSHNPRELPAGTFVVRHSGKLYLMEDPKGAAYQMFRDMMVH